MANNMTPEYIALWKPRMEAVAKKGVSACSGGVDGEATRWDCVECPLRPCRERARAFLDTLKEGEG